MFVKTERLGWTYGLGPQQHRVYRTGDDLGLSKAGVCLDPAYWVPHGHRLPQRGQHLFPVGDAHAAGLWPNDNMADILAPAVFCVLCYRHPQGQLLYRGNTWVTFVHFRVLCIHIFVNRNPAVLYLQSLACCSQVLGICKAKILIQIVNM